MDYKEPTQIVEKADIVPLTASNYSDFVKNTEEFFDTKGTQFLKCFRPGYNSNSAKKYSWKDGQPDWILDRFVVFDKIEQKEIPDENKSWIHVQFESGLGEVLGPKRTGQPVNTSYLDKFAFVGDNGALYLRDEHSNGTSEFPWETLYIHI